MTPPRERLREACHATKWIGNLDWSILTTNAGLELRVIVRDKHGEKIHMAETFDPAWLETATDAELADRLDAVADLAVSYTQVGAPRGTVLKVDHQKAEVTLAMMDETIASVQVGQEFRLR